MAGRRAAGVGVSANTTSGTAVIALAESGGTGVSTTSIGGTALQVTGRTSFSRSGLATVPVAVSQKTITVANGFASSSVVLATLESNQSGLAIQRVKKNTSMGKFTVFLSTAVASGKTAKVGWFVIG